MLHTADTIAAIASPPGSAPRGVVRVGGPSVVATLDACFRPSEPTPLSAIVRPRVVPGTMLLASSAFDEVPVDLLLWPTDRSYTRQPMAELHTIGSPPLLAAVLATVCRHGARLAQPGEFTLRAFLAGRLDLAQAEAVLGVIDARNRAELHWALGQLAGGMTQPLHALRDRLMDLLAHLEAGLDFVEEDIRFIERDEIQRQLDDAMALVEQTLSQLATRTRHDALSLVALMGWPNVGKSSLFNRLVPEGSALVANQPGTTRDYLTGTLDLGGVVCQLCDTAGVETVIAAAGDSLHADIRQSAQHLGASQAARAELCIVCLDATRDLNCWEREQLATIHAGPRLVVLTKSDAPGCLEAPPGAIATSALSGSGLAELRTAIRAKLGETANGETAAQITADRCVDSLRAAGETLQRAGQLNRASAGEELIGSELRLALDELGKVVGATYTDDILDRVFSRFCIGK
ncbi:MAG: tRNA modification GTPase [Pirellulales bacterium]